MLKNFFKIEPEKSFLKFKEEYIEFEKKKQKDKFFQKNWTIVKDPKKYAQHIDFCEKELTLYILINQDLQYLYELFLNNDMSLKIENFNNEEKNIEKILRKINDGSSKKSKLNLNHLKKFLFKIIMEQDPQVFKKFWAPHLEQYPEIIKEISNCITWGYYHQSNDYLNKGYYNHEILKENQYSVEVRYYLINKYLDYWIDYYKNYNNINNDIEENFYNNFTFHQINDEQILKYSSIQEKIKKIKELNPDKYLEIMEKISKVTEIHNYFNYNLLRAKDLDEILFCFEKDIFTFEDLEFFISKSKQNISPKTIQLFFEKLNEEQKISIQKQILSEFVLGSKLNENQNTEIVKFVLNQDLSKIKNLFTKENFKDIVHYIITNDKHILLENKNIFYTIIAKVAEDNQIELIDFLMRDSLIEHNDLFFITQEKRKIEKLLVVKTENISNK